MRVRVLYGPPHDDWLCLGMSDDARGLWMRAEPGLVEFCSGRGGDDAHASFKVGQMVTPKDVHDLVQVFDRALWQEAERIDGARARIEAYFDACAASLPGEKKTR